MHARTPLSTYILTDGCFCSWPSQNRAVTHKTTCVQISIIALAGLVCTYQKLRAFIYATVSISWLGRLGANMFMDRVNELVNLLRQQRCGTSAAFQSSMIFTPLLLPAMHVEHAWTMQTQGDHPANDPLRQSHLNGAQVFVMRS